MAVGLSDTSVHIFDISSERGLTHIQNIPSITEATNKNLNVCGVRFLDDTPNTLLVGTTNGFVRLFDLRTQTEEARFKNDKKPAQNHISCFDRNANSRLLCTGTEELESSVYMFFYDIREQKLMGHYSDSHQGEVTTLRFHPQNPDILGSGSTDGLINTFDLRETSEDDALQITINTESSVQKINW